jgi:endoglucanase
LLGGRKRGTMKAMRRFSGLAVILPFVICLGLITPARATPTGHVRLIAILPQRLLHPQPLPTDQSFALHPDGPRLVDAQGHPFRIAAVNWYGAEEEDFVPGGLNQQSHIAILEEIRSLGYNTIRLPLSDQLVRDNPIITKGVDADPQLLGLHALDALGIILKDAARFGLRIILDNHRSEAGWGAESNGLWYNTQAGYSEATWLDDWRLLAALSLQWPNVIGMDLRDEPHTRGRYPWTPSAYLTGATWGTGDPSYDPTDPLNSYCTLSNNCHDWRLAAERAGDAILAINPRLLIFVEGTELYQTVNTIDENWWGGNLEGVATYPVQFVVDGKDITAAHLVYSPHEYGPSVFPNPEFGGTTTPTTLDAEWQRFWGYLDTPGKPYTAPLFLGEFGTCNTGPTCISVDNPGSQGQWFSALIAYLHAHPDISWAYWALNGTQSPAPGRQDGAPESYGLLNPNWNAVSNQDLQNALASIQPTNR